MFSLFIHGDAKPKGSKRVFMTKGRPVLVEANKDVKSWELTLTENIWEHSIKHVGKELSWEGPIEVGLSFFLRRPKSAKKRLFPHVMPDIDKLCRTVLDALVSAGVVRDDGQVVRFSRLEKLYADSSPPGVWIEVRKLEASDGD